MFVGLNLYEPSDTLFASGPRIVDLVAFRNGPRIDAEKDQLSYKFVTPQFKGQ